MMSPFWIITIIFLSSLPSVSSQLPYDDYPTANISTSWINNVRHTWTVIKAATGLVRIILLRRNSLDDDYACGFYCNGNGTCNSYLFAIFTISPFPGADVGSPQVVWSANRNNPVGENATLELTAYGDLVLRDADASPAWSTNTAGKSVVGLNLTEMGNLVLFDRNNSVVWQSFDHPTDCLVPGQILVSGKNLTSSSEGGMLFSVSMTDKGLVASILSEPPQIYYESMHSAGYNKKIGAASYAKFEDGSLDLYINGVEPSSPDITIVIPPALSAQYMKLGPDGHLRVFRSDYNLSWKEVADIFAPLDECRYPMVCGKYGVCANGQCSCPSDGSVFRPINDGRPDLGCSEVVPLTCNASDNHSFLDFENVTYFSFISDIKNTDMSSCKEACLKNCSCKAAIFRSATGDCYLPSEIFSLMQNKEPHTNYTSFISLKVQIELPKRKTSLFWPITGSVLGVIYLAIVVGTAVFVCRRRRKPEQVDEIYLDHVPGTRFSYEELATATNNFNKKLGEGGFGSVFEGLLINGTRIAVKCLDGVGHIKKSFLTEVETICSIHHINLVKLIGFCVEKSHRLLVYEYMSRGSLDRWIYCRREETTLDWNHRRRVIYDIAKGLAYLHEGCRKKIIHLDIKPQNILLDEHYNAKLADFGLSKLVDRNQSRVMTTMKGTPGYLAPEWRGAVITEKVDVYGFGVVVLEIMSGRKVFEQWRSEEESHLPTFFMRKAEEGEWLYVVDRCCLDVESNVGEIEEMMQIAAWCLQSDHRKRPPISMVIKVLEGVKDVPKGVDCNLITVSRIPGVDYKGVTHLLPSVLSGPR